MSKYKRESNKYRREDGEFSNSHNNVLTQKEHKVWNRRKAIMACIAATGIAVGIGAGIGIGYSAFANKGTIGVKFTSREELDEFFKDKLKIFDSEDDKFSVPSVESVDFSEEISNYFFAGERLWGWNLIYINLLSNIVFASPANPLCLNFSNIGEGSYTYVFTADFITAGTYHSSYGTSAETIFKKHSIFSLTISNHHTNFYSHQYVSGFVYYSDTNIKENSTDIAQDIFFVNETYELEKLDDQIRFMSRNSSSDKLNFPIYLNNICYPEINFGGENEI